MGARAWFRSPSESTPLGLRMVCERVSSRLLSASLTPKFTLYKPLSGTSKRHRRKSEPLLQLQTPCGPRRYDTFICDMKNDITHPKTFSIVVAKLSFSVNILSVCWHSCHFKSFVTGKCALLLIYLFTWPIHINKHNCKRARISPKGYFSYEDP